MFKPLFPILLMALFCGCSFYGDSQNQSGQSQVVNGEPRPTLSLSQSPGTSAEVTSLAPANDQEIAQIETVKEQEKQKAEQIPPEFKYVDFGNMVFQNLSPGEYRESKAIPLKKSRYEFDDPRYSGGTEYSLDSVYFVDLTGDNRKEAVVLIDALSCGGSCDGGSAMIYLFAAGHKRPKFIGGINTGSRSGGCSLKSLKIAEKKIILEQFGRCSPDAAHSKEDYSCKFCEKDETRSVYSLINGRLHRISAKVTHTPETNVMNYKTEISVDN